MNNNKVKRIDEVLKLHSSYSGNYGNGTRYLDAMDQLAWHYPSGAKAIRLSMMLDDYYKEVGVSNLEEAFNRLRKLEEQ